MLYFVKKKDTLTSIAEGFKTTPQNITKANVICNPSMITAGEPIIIPESGLELPKAGAGPYYLMRTGDTLDCLAQQTGIAIKTLMAVNDIQNPNINYQGVELLIVTPSKASPEELKLSWEKTPDKNCTVYGFTEHGVFYLGSFEWAAYGQKAVPYLIELLKNRCEIVQRYALISLGRIGLNGNVKKALLPFFSDASLSDLAHLVMRRIDLSEKGYRSVHVTLADNKIFSEPNLSSKTVNLPKGSEIAVMRWFIPSPTGEEGPKGGIQIYDYVWVSSTKQAGFMPRFGSGEITFI